MNYIFNHFKNKPSGDIGIYTINGEITVKNQDELALILMKAIHGMDFAIFDLSGVTRIDTLCCRLLDKACNISARFKKPLILTGIRLSAIEDIIMKDILLNKKRTVKFDKEMIDIHQDGV
ncbi:MAG: hypothetical protein HY808_14020 [Nitrospirae bacterium]|nr:hypothetical protein [Nitrospirota bacterium]